METILQIPKITVRYKDKDAACREKITSSRMAYNILRPIYADCMQHHEEFWVMYLNIAAKLLGVTCISRGGVSQTCVDIKIILQTALLTHASGIIISHNHPSGSTVASNADKYLTNRIKKACDVIEITFKDHIILTETGYFSYSDEGLL